jgi:hydrocephalus-inducing protein
MKATSTSPPDVTHTQVIKVKLMSDVLGNFDEVFKWAIRGSSTPLTLAMRGRVRGPVPEVDADCLDFGIVSYGFR